MAPANQLENLAIDSTVLPRFVSKAGEMVDQSHVGEIRREIYVQMLGTSANLLSVEHDEEKHNWKHKEEEETVDNVYIILKQWKFRPITIESGIWSKRKSAFSNTLLRSSLCIFCFIANNYPGLQTG